MLIRLVASAFALLVTVSPAALATASDDVRGLGVDFLRHDVHGRVLQLSAFRGRWVVVNFWATWCGPCVREMPMLRNLHRDRADVVVVGVNFEEISDGALHAFLQELDIDYPVVRAGAAPLVPFEPLKGLPSTFLVSPAGRIVAARLGEIDRAWIDAAIATAGSKGNAGD